MLVIDAGNSAVKFAMVKRAGATPKLLRSVPTAKLTVAALRRIGRSRSSVVASSVVPAATRILKRAFPGAHFIGPRTAIDLKTLVDRRTIGSDRLANVAAAGARYGTSILVASFGTAATFDIIDAKGLHRGGVIAPGWGSFADILPARTALLPHITRTAATRSIGRNTREALLAGVAGGYAAMVTDLIARMKKETRMKNLRVILTGGDAAAVNAILPHKFITDPLLTLRGIAILAHGTANEARK